MPVLLFDSGSKFHSTWADQWLKADPLNRKKVPISTGKHKALRDVIVSAAKLAGQTAFNELIIGVGHGGAGAFPGEGTVELAPNGRMVIAKAIIGSHPLNSHGVPGNEVFFDPFYDFVFGGVGQIKSQKMLDDDSVRLNDFSAPAARFRLGRFAIYQSIASAVRGSHINQVVFLTCRVGNSVDFLKKIAFDWKVKVKAYTRRIVFQLNSPGTGRGRVFLEGDTDGVKSNTVAGETDIPQIDFITVGPPPVPPPMPRPAPPRRLKKRADLSPWIDIDGQLVHPDAPAGGRGKGHFKTAGIQSTDLIFSALPNPFSPAARTLNPFDLQRSAPQENV